MDIYNLDAIWLIAYDHLVARNQTKQADLIKATSLSSPHLSTSLGKNRKGNVSDTIKEEVSRYFDKTVDQMIELGKELAGVNNDEASAMSGIKTGLSAETIKDLSNEQLYAKVADVNFGISTFLNDAVKEMQRLGRVLSDERNRLLTKNQRLESTFNSVEEQVRVVGKDKIILYCNRSFEENNNLTIGDTCEKETCDNCKKNLNCIVENVFKSGKREMLVYKKCDSWYATAAYPVFSLTGKVEKAIVVTRSIIGFLDLMTSAGWTIEEPKEQDNEVSNGC